MSVRFGYSLWGFLGDYKEDLDGNALSTPDGTSTYAWSILHEAQKRGWKTFLMQQDRDRPAIKKHSFRNFEHFSCNKRCEAYTNVQDASHEFPELDVLLIEWRWPIPNVNCDPKCDHCRGEPTSSCFSWQRGKHNPDLARQLQLLLHYSEKKTKIIFWDLDHKLTRDDERLWRCDAIFETSVVPRELIKKRVRVEPPFVIDDLMQMLPLEANSAKKLVYVGSRYERDDVITEYIKPASDYWPQEIEFYGNWSKTLDECKKLWPNVKYCDRITTRDFRAAYGTAVACPLLAKRSYMETGFITPRVWEALLFGTIPIGLAQTTGIENYVLHTASSGEEMIDVVKRLSSFTFDQRRDCRAENIDKIRFMDVSNFVNRIEEVL